MKDKLISLKLSVMLLIGVLYAGVISYCLLARFTTTFAVENTGKMPLLISACAVVCCIFFVLYVAHTVYKVLQLWRTQALSNESLAQNELAREMRDLLRNVAIAVALSVILSLAWNGYSQELAKLPQYAGIFN